MASWDWVPTAGFSSSSAILTCGYRSWWLWQQVCAHLAQPGPEEAGRHLFTGCPTEDRCGPQSSGLLSLPYVPPFFSHQLREITNTLPCSKPARPLLAPCSEVFPIQWESRKKKGSIRNDEVSFTHYEIKRPEHLTAVREGFLKEVTLELVLE